MERRNIQAIYFTEGGKQKLLGYLTTLNEKMVLAYVKDGKITSYKYVSELKNEIVKFTLSSKQRKSSITR